MPGSENQTEYANSPADEAARGSGRTVTRNSLPGQARQFLESLLCLALAVIVFRAFLVEGYMISTGSMAPSLLGFHKQVVCPTCRYPFPFGVPYQSDRRDTISGDDEDAGDDTGRRVETRQLCTCPNCGQHAIDISQVPRNQGDQLLVFREAYCQRLPRRWEVIVFRNPQKTTQAYVKRLAGLPGETIEIRDGDVYADGTLCRKNYATQKAVRIPVYNHDYEPADDPAWQSRWRPDAGWRRRGQGFVTQNPTPADDSKTNEAVPAPHGLNLPREEMSWQWVTYGHFLRSGGRHVTKVPVPILKEPLQWPDDLLPARFDVKTRQLSVRGVVSADLRERLQSVSSDPLYLQAVDRLSQRSQFSPVTDDYGYNRASPRSGGNSVRDVMISLQLHVPEQLPTDGSPRQFAVDMTDGGQTFRLLLDFAKQEIRLLGNPEVTPDGAPLRTANWPAEGHNGSWEIEMSLFDRQVTVAMDGEEVFPAWPIPGPRPERESPRYPVRVGSLGLAANVDSLRLFRDVYYTSEDDDAPFSLKDNELYVLGDNSPISLDSRRWKNGAVPLRLLLGKPFVVHLPSRQMKIRAGEAIRHIRIPDFSRIRYIR